MKNFTEYFTFLFLYLILFQSQAFGQNDELIKKFSLANNSSNVSYDYKIILRNTYNMQYLDSVKGFLITKDGEYIDSSSQSFTARVGDFYCRLDHLEQTISVANMKLISKKAGVRLENNNNKIIHNINDALLKSNGNYVIEKGNLNFFRIKIYMKNYPVSFIQIDFGKKDFKMLNAYYEMEEKNLYDRKKSYLTKIYLNNIKNTDQSQLNSLARIFTVSKSKVIINPKYSKYTFIPFE